MEPGTVLLGKYRVDEVIGAGGMGRVVRASHLYLQQSVAIKVLLREMADSATTVSRFLREAQAAVQLKSEHIARVIDVGTLHDGAPVMVMEYLTGNDLNQILRHHGPQTPAIVCDLMLQACEGIAEAHSIGIVHRDIKPSNFFITQRPDGSMLLKILDFGISKTPVGITELTNTQTVLGTPTYMAPEQMKSGRTADARSDIWSMGVVMYQLLNGRPPFGGESYAALVLQVNGEPPAPMHVPLPAGLGEVILRCLEKDPKSRQQNVGELARTIAPFASDPVAAALSAARTTRILQHKPGAPILLPLTAGGGLATPVPLSPAQLTPRSWPPSSSSLAQSAGQVTYQTRAARRGWIIAGVTALVVLAGAGGFAANSMMKDDEPAKRNEPYVQVPASAPEPDTDTPAATAPAPPPAASAPAPAPPASAPAPAPAVAPGMAAIPPPSPTFPARAEPTPDAKVAAKPAAKAEPRPAAKAEPRPVAAVKAEPRPAARPAMTEPKPAARPTARVEPKPKPAAKPATKPGKSGKSDDLFDTRH